jgi:hypothetical protein
MGNEPNLHHEEPRIQAKEMKPSRVQQAIKILKASTEDLAAEKKKRVSKEVQAKKVKTVKRAK